MFDFLKNILYLNYQVIMIYDPTILQKVMIVCFVLVSSWFYIIMQFLFRKVFYPKLKSINYFSRSQGFSPVCFLKAVLKWEIEEYPSIIDTSVTLSPFSYKRYLACSMRWFW